MLRGRKFTIIMRYKRKQIKIKNLRLHKNKQLRRKLVDCVALQLQARVDLLYKKAHSI